MTSYQFVPRYQFITDITNTQYAVVTFEDEHDFSDGEIIGLRISKPYGMVEANNKEVKVLSHDSMSVTIDLDTTTFTPFTYPVDGLNTPPIAVPSASGIIPDSNPATMNLEDAFDNIRTN
jgi:hypothetical protein